MSHDAARLTITSWGSVELPEDDPIFGTFWLAGSREEGCATGVVAAIAFAERRVSEADFRCFGPAKRRFEPRRIVVRDASQRLVLGGKVVGDAIEWCMPVASDEEAARVRQQADALNNDGELENGWDNYSTAQGLWAQAALVEARLVDPAWRTHTLATLQARSHSRDHSIA